MFVRSVLLCCVLLAAGCSSGDGADAGPSPDPAGELATGQPSPTPRPSAVGGVELEVVPAKVDRVADGDSFDAVIDGQAARVRLIGINANEGFECFGAEAGAELTRLIGGRTIDLLVPPGDPDEFGRVLAYAYDGDRNLNELLVRTGFAVARDQSGHPFASEFEAAELRARGERLGLWAPDACGVAQDLAVGIGEIEPDAPGPDPENPNGEWVEIVNEGERAVALGGWVVKDESTRHRYRFAADFELDPGAAVRLFSGCGDDTGTELYWCKIDDSVWNNDGDTVFLLDEVGNVVDAVPYIDE